MLGEEEVRPAMVAVEMRIKIELLTELLRCSLEWCLQEKKWSPIGSKELAH